MIYEYRVYYAAPGKMDSLHRRFADHTIRIFRKHGIKVVGFWVTENKEDEVLNYLLVFDSTDKMKEQWAAFGSDPEWNRVRDESQRDGDLVAKIESTILYPTSYSPLQ